MSRRVRHTSVTAEEAQPAGPRAAPVDSIGSSWNAVFHGFSADDRARILALAHPAGIVYAQQLPDPGLSRKSDEQARSVFSPFLNGQAAQLEPTEIEPSTACFDPELDRWQKEAVAKALATRDLFLLRGHPGSGKSRVLVEIIRQANQRGSRVLLLSRTTAALDCVLISLAAAGDCIALRCPQPGESDQLLRPEVRAALLESRLTELARRAHSAGNEDRTTSQQACLEFAQALAVYSSLVEFLDKKTVLEKSRLALAFRQTSLKEELAALSGCGPDSHLTGDFAVQMSAWSQERNQQNARAEDEVKKLDQVLKECRAKLAQLQAESARLGPILQARTSGRFWSLAWWKALLRPADVRRALKVDQILSAAQAEIDQQEKALAAAVTEQQRVEVETAADRNRLLAEEANRREACFAADKGALDRQIAELGEHWLALCNRAPLLRKESIENHNDLERTRLTWAQGQEQARAATLRAEQWLSLLADHPNTLREALLENAPVFAATAAGWAAARGVVDKLAGNPFDLLILEEAEEFSETECATYVGLASRWLFVGSDYLLDSDLSESSRDVSQRGESSSLRPSVFFGQLWQRLHSSPERLPYAWVEDGDKLICRLRPILPEQRAWIEIERLADHPQIVLHILALPRSRPVVAEVVFPAAFTIQGAKRFILQELQELAVCSSGRSMRWYDDHSRHLVLQLAIHACHHPAEVELAPGVRELLKPQEGIENGKLPTVAWQTCCIEFDRESGWQRHTAEEWVERHLGLRDVGRTLFLDGFHRYTPGMAAFVKSLLFLSTREAFDFPEDGAGQWNQPVEYVGVPSHGPPRAEQARGTRARSAGLELDLSDPKTRDRLPVELRSGLPATGFVNLSEAQAIISRLVNLVHDRPVSFHVADEPAILVIALYESQAELIRRLLRSSPLLAPHARSIEVSIPRSFAHREAACVIVSLTRSHSHRATGFGAGPKEIILALSRAREKLIVFGDGGALARRANWEGPVECLDSCQADLERQLVRMLLAGFQKLDSRTAFVGSEGSAL